MAIIPVVEWMPDRADFGSEGAKTVQNVYPRTKDSYGPMPTPRVYSGALTARCQGSYAFVDASSAPNIFAGDATKLYRMTAGTAPNFADVSRVVAAPLIPVLSDVAGGALPGVTYFVWLTYTNAQGETTVSLEASHITAANRLLKVTSPIAATGAVGYNVYVGIATTTETKQNVSPIAITTDWTEPVGGLIAGSLAPSANTADIPYTTGSPVHPAIPTMPGWSMTSYGERIVATNYSDDVQTLLIPTDSKFSALSSGAPKARYVATIKDFLFLGNTTDAVYGAKPRRLWWSAIGNPTSWPTPASNAAIQVQSDYQDLEQSDLGQMTGLLGGHLASSDGAAFMERGIYRIDYVGSRDGIFSFKVAEGASGTSAPLSIIPGRVLGRTAAALYLGDNDFYAYDGTSSTAIGFGKIARTFFDELDQSYLSAVQGISDPRLPLVYWLYHAGTAGAFYDRLLVYNTILGRWAVCDLTATPVEWIGHTVTVGTTLDALDVFGSLDAVPAPLSSGDWVGNRPMLAVFDNSHRLNQLAGPAMAATVDTAETQPNPGLRSRTAVVRPLVDGITPSVAMGTRERLVDAVTYKAAVPINAIGECPQRGTGRYVRWRITLPAAALWNHIEGVEVSAPAEGRR